MVGNRPDPPFSTWPIQLHEEGFAYAWYLEPAIFVLQARLSFGTMEFVERYNDLIDHVLSVKADSVAKAGGLFILHDWRQLTGYDKEARARASERMKARKAGYSRRSVVAVSPKSRLLRMAVEAVNLFAVVTLRSKVELVTDPAPILTKMRIDPPAPGSQFP